MPAAAASSDGGRGLPAAEGRLLRADAQRNCDTLVVVARAAFAAATHEHVSLESIARAAEVGIGTLYRHFPTREALVEAVYAVELDELVASAGTLLEALPPEAALRAWFYRYAEFLTTKRGMIETLRAGWSSGRLATPATRERLTAALATILAAGARAGVLRGDVEPGDVTAMLLGVFLSTVAGGTPDQTERLLGLLVDALRPQANGPPCQPHGA